MKKLLIYPLFLLILISSVLAINFNDCIDITSSGTYDLTENIYKNMSAEPSAECIVIRNGTNDVTIDCHDYKIQDNATYVDINDIAITVDVHNDNILIKNCEIEDFNTSITTTAGNFTNITIRDNKLLDTEVGITFGVSNITVYEDIIIHNNLINNTVNAIVTPNTNNSQYTDNTIIDGTRGIHFNSFLGNISRHNIVISGNTLTNIAEYGIYHISLLGNPITFQNLNVSYNTITNANGSIRLENSGTAPISVGVVVHDNIISNSNIGDGGYVLSVYKTIGAGIYRNIITSTGLNNGIQLEGGFFDSIYGNDITMSRSTDAERRVNKSITVEAFDLLIENNSIVGGYIDIGALVTNTVIKDNLIDIDQASNTAISLGFNAHGKKIEGNDISGWLSTGIYSIFVDDMNITGNTLHDGYDTTLFFTSERIIVENNTAFNNNVGLNFCVLGASTTQVRYNRLFDNNLGIAIVGAGLGCGASNLNISENDIYSNVKGINFLDSDNTNQFINNNVYDNDDVQVNSSTARNITGNYFGYNAMNVNTSECLTTYTENGVTDLNPYCTLYGWECSSWTCTTYGICSAGSKSCEAITGDPSGFCTDSLYQGVYAEFQDISPEECQTGVLYAGMIPLIFTFILILAGALTILGLGYGLFLASKNYTISEKIFTIIFYVVFIAIVVTLVNFGRTLFT